MKVLVIGGGSILGRIVAEGLAAAPFAMTVSQVPG